jgi:hypothetical protein
MKIETQAVHAGRRIDPATGAVTPPIHLSTTFERHPDGEYPLGFSYAREGNPTRRSLEECLAALEGGKEALAFSSGLAVATALLQGLEPGDHIIAPDDVYFGLRQVIGGLFAKWPLKTSYVDMTDLAAVRAAVCPTTRLVLIETPSNPLMKITDLVAVAKIAREANAISVCDGTFTTAGHPAPTGLRCRHGLALDHEIPGRSQRHDGRRAHHATRQLSFRASAQVAHVRRSGAISFRLLARASWRQHVALADARAFWERTDGRRVLRAPPGRRTGLLPRISRAPWS